MTTFAEHPSTPTADGALVRAHFAGDEDALEILFRRYRPDVRRTMLSKTRNAPLAEDLTQDTMLRAQRYLGTYNTSLPFWPWLHKIAVNIATSECARRSAELPVDPVDGIELALPDSSEHIVLHALVMECLAKLPKRHQHALVLRYVEDRDPNDIAALFGLKRNALEQLLLRARKRFAAEFRARNVALVPGFAGLSHRLRRAFAGLSNRLQYAGGTTFSTAGDFALGAAALTVGGIGIVTTFGGHHHAADPRAAAPRPGFTIGSTSYAPAGTAGGGVSVSPRAMQGALVGGGTERATGATGDVTAGHAVEPGVPADPAADEGAPGDSVEGVGTDAPDTPADTVRVEQQEPSVGVDTPTVAGDAPPTPPDPDVNIRGEGPAPETSVDIREDETYAGVSDDSAGNNSGEVTLTHWTGQEGVIATEEVKTDAAGRPYEVKVETTNSGDSQVLCGTLGLC